MYNVNKLFITVQKKENAQDCKKEWRWEEITEDHNNKKYYNSEEPESCATSNSYE